MDRVADFLIIGSGIAGLRAAVELAGSGGVVLLTKAEPNEGNTGYAQGGIAAAVGPDDSPERHGADTIAAGDGLCDPAAVRVLVDGGPRYVRKLIAWGAAFDLDEGGEPHLTLEGAHSVRRVLHAGDRTGRELTRVLWARVSRLRDVSTIDHARVVDLLVRNGRCSGAIYLSDDGEAHAVSARSVLLATGGAGQVFSDTTNPPVATGDGIAMAYRAGARMIDLEFVQFHPTALLLPGQPRFLLSEALRGEGARLVNASGEAFMPRYDPAGDLAPRDRVARAIERESIRTGQPIYLTLQHLDSSFVHRRFPLLSQTCRDLGLDLARDRIPIGPAAHYVMGGVETDLSGRTNIPGLFAAGEVACTGVHGANRLASNSLLEGLVFGARAGAAMRSLAGQPEDVRGEPAGGGMPRKVEGSSGEQLSIRDVQRLMWKHVGLVRDADDLRNALAVLEPARLEAERRLGDTDRASSDLWRLLNVLTTGTLIARAALRREESRGAHYRTDYPRRDDIHWKRRVGETVGSTPDRSPADAVSSRRTSNG